MADDESPIAILLTLAAAGLILLLLSRRFASPVGVGVAAAGAAALYALRWPARQARRRERRARLAELVRRAA